MGKIMVVFSKGDSTVKKRDIRAQIKSNLDLMTIIMLMFLKLIPIVKS